jgi:hypothetical protein
MKINLLQLSWVLATTLAVLAGCGYRNPGVSSGHGPAQYVCGDQKVQVTATAIAPELLYLCDDNSHKITWQFDASVQGVSIEFKPDYPFNGLPRPIVSRPGDDHVDSPPIPKKSQLMLYKYSITITPKSGQATTLDPHVLSGGSY